tara:strand:+ start:859 stop:2697 length:1839 start_codon:yes stop_codon:yes gene_type:complete
MKKDIIYEPWKVYQSSDVPALGVSARSIRNFLGAEHEYDIEQPISASRAIISSSFSGYTGYGSMSGHYDHTEDVKKTLMYLVDDLKLMPKSPSVWRIGLPNTINEEYDEIVLQITQSEIVYNANVVEFTDNNGGGIIEQETEFIDYTFANQDVNGAQGNQRISLNNGFNYFSTYVNYPLIDFVQFLTASLYNTTTNEYVTEATLRSEDGPVLIAKDNSGGAFGSTFFNGATSTIGDYDINQGYLIKMDGDNYDLIISGSIFREKTIELQSGWNIMPFPSIGSLSPNSVFDPISDQIIIVRDINGAIFQYRDIDGNDAPFNGIGNLEPGNAYQVKISGNPVSITFTNDIDIPGCTNPLAENYNSEATIDDGSCIVKGCTNPVANNYDATANVDDGTCNFISVIADSQFIKMPLTIPDPLASFAPNFTNYATTVNRNYISTNRNIAANFDAGVPYKSVKDIFENFLFIEGGDQIINTADIIEEVKYSPNIGNPKRYIPGSQNDIGDMEPGVGYYVTLNNDRDKTVRYELRIPGAAVEVFTYTLYAGWNDIGVPFANVRAPEAVFASIIDKIIIMKDGAGDTWQPEYSNVASFKMIPTHGYQIKLLETCYVNVTL